MFSSYGLAREKPSNICRSKGEILQQLLCDICLYLHITLYLNPLHFNYIFLLVYDYDMWFVKNNDQPQSLPQKNL